MLRFELSGGGRRSRRYRRLGLAAAVLGTAAVIPAAVQAKPASFGFQPIAIQRINLPRSINSAGWPVFTRDGKHLMFFSTSAHSTGGSTGPGTTAALWMVNLDGKHPHCLSCGVINDPTSQGEGEIDPFPDGKRVFFGSSLQPGAGKYGVLDCEPSLVDCKTKTILPVNFSSAQPADIPPGGAITTSQSDSGGAYAAKLSQDGQYVGFSDIRSDSIETMVVGKLTRSGDEYVVTDPRVINPQGPSSASDPDVAHWSNGGALYEFKTFTDGGADATYVESGGASLLNPDVYSVNLATGRRTRLTSNPDYDEDNAVSPDGKLLALWSNRTMHLTDWLAGLLPVPDFIDAPAAVLSTSISSSNKRCHGPIWILPSSGDDDAHLLGQPIVDYRVPHVFVTNNLVGWPQWSPNGTMLALNTTNNTAGSAYPAHARFLLVAHFTALKPTRPLPTVSSQPGSWAVAPTAYHPDFGYDGTVTLHGPHGGTVVISYGGLSGIFSGQWSETYTNYSSNGRDLINGTVSIAGSVEAGTYSSHLTMTGADTGDDDVDLSFGNGAVQGHGESTYNGHTVRGPSAEQAAAGACPAIQPKEPKLHVTESVLRRGDHRLTVSASIAGAGANEAATATEPVDHATITIGHTTIYTNSDGVAILSPTQTGHVSVTAGDTLTGTSIDLSSVSARTDEAFQRPRGS